MMNIQTPNIIRNLIRSGENIGPALSAVSEDLESISSLISSSEGLLTTAIKYPSVNALRDGLSGDTILVSDNIKSGPLFNDGLSRPKTVRETLEFLAKAIDVDVDPTNIVQVISVIKNRIGSEVFNGSLAIEDESLSIHRRLSNVENAIKQLASDIFNENKSVGADQDYTNYLISGKSQTNNLSVMDMIKMLISTHGGMANINHSLLEKEEVIDVSTSRLNFTGGENKFLFPGIATKSNSFNDQTYLYKYTGKSQIDKILVCVSSNNLAGSCYISIFKNGSEWGNKLVVGPNASGIFELNDIGLPLSYKDSVCLKISTQGATNGSISIDCSSLTIVKSV